MPINPLFPYPLYLVISAQDCYPKKWLYVAEEAIIGGVDIIQLREKGDDRDTFLEKAIKLKTITDHYGIPLVINDAVDVAHQIGAWGVHVGQSDVQPLVIREKYGDKLSIGWSIEDMRQLESQQMQAVNHLGVSPIFSTPTKKDTVIEWGVEGLKELRKNTEKPLIAIGSMNTQTAAHAWNSGADSIAVVSAICQSKDPREASAQLKELLK